jgi:signal transduction histidine kinase/CheY-like chemotaxis protein
MEAYGPSGIDLLRPQAEARLRERGSTAGGWSGATPHELDLYRMELEIQNQSLQELRVEAEAAMSRLAEINGQLEGLVATRTEQLESALRQAEKASREKSRFLSTMSHELRTPLSAIMGMTRLASRLAVDSQQQRYFEIVERSLLDLNGILNDVLDVSRIEAGGISLKVTHLQLAGIFDEVRNLMLCKTAEKGLQLVFELPPECARLPLMGDSLRLRQILINLVVNAAKFTELGSIHVRCMPMERDEHELRLRFEIEDTGGGIGAEHQKRLFLPFEQLDGSITRTHGGSGLGLAISKELVTVMGGAIGVASEVGKGSLFWFEIPLAVGAEILAPAGHPGGLDPEAAIRAGHAGSRVLVVEDDLINQEFLKVLLERSGLRVDVAGTGAQALLAVRSIRYELILMDLRMPEMDGFQATREIRALPEHRETPIIALTADVFEEDRRRCLEAGMNAHLGKPVEPSLLFATVLEWLGARRDGTVDALGAGG